MSTLRIPVVVVKAVLVVACLLSASCRGRAKNLACDSLGGMWETSLGAASGYHFTGTIAFQPTPHVDLTGISADGAREQISYAVDSLVVHSDSIALRFAPLGIRVAGRCVSADSIAAVFEFPQPPYGPLRGDGYLRRTR